MNNSSYKFLLEAMDSSKEALSEESRSNSEIYAHESMVSSKSDESLGEVDDEEALHKRLISYETIKIRLLLTLAVTEFYFP